MNRKVIIITGASQGLGKELALNLSKYKGAKIVLIARSEELLREVKKQCIKNGAESEYFVCDIRDRKQIIETVRGIKNKFGTIDILINNAGIWTDNNLEEDNPELKQKAFETNVLGHINFTYEVLPVLKEKEVGHILNVISTAAARDIPAGDNTGWRVYGATKWAMAGFSKDLANSLRDTKIKVTRFMPGGFDSNLYENAGWEESHGLPWMMKVKDVAGIIEFVLTRPDDVYMEEIVFSKL